MKQAIQELDDLNEVWNLRLNKVKSQVLTEDNIPEIADIPCDTHTYPHRSEGAKGEVHRQHQAQPRSPEMETSQGGPRHQGDAHLRAS